MIGIEPSCDHRHGFEVPGPVIAITIILIAVIYLLVGTCMKCQDCWWIGKHDAEIMMFRCLNFHMPLNLQTHSIRMVVFIHSVKQQFRVCLQNFYFEIPWIFQVFRTTKIPFSKQLYFPELDLNSDIRLSHSLRSVRVQRLPNWDIACPTRRCKFVFLRWWDLDYIELYLFPGGGANVCPELLISPDQRASVALKVQSKQKASVVSYQIS